MTLFLLTTVVAALLCAPDTVKTSPTFEGKWLRDEIIGKNGKPLPRITWTIKFDETAITLVESSDNGVPIRRPKYNLNGSEASHTVQNSPASNTTRLIARKDRLIEVSEIMPSTDGTSMKITEIWELVNGGNTLKVVRKFQIRNHDGPMPIGIADQVYSFQRMPPKP